jgi:hypothetical protein
LPWAGSAGSLRRIQLATRIRRETAAAYLKAAGIPIPAPGDWGRNPAAAAKPAIEVATDPAAEKPPDLATPEAERQPGRCPSSSACEPYRELIELGLSRGRNAMAIWQDLVDDHGFSGLSPLAVALRDSNMVERKNFFFVF